MSDGRQVEHGDLIVVLEAVKWRTVTAHQPGTIASVAFADGQASSQGEVLCEIKDELCHARN